MTLHPTSREKIKLTHQIENLLAVKKNKFAGCITYPNSDLGHQIIINKFKKICATNKNLN